MGNPGTTTETESVSGSGQSRRILLLEDDTQLLEIIREYLVIQGFDVVSASNGVEGVREIIAGEFGVIVCDMMMPKLAGDMFYLAVERMRPHLCDKFIFITGQQGNPKVMAFIHKLGGIVLSKPFLMDDLLDMISFVSLRTVLQSA